MTPSDRVSTLRIVVVCDTADAAIRAGRMQRSGTLHAGLREAGYDVVATLAPDIFLPDHILRIGPDLIIVDSESDARDVLEHLVIATRDARRPIVLFTEDDSVAAMEAAMAAGVSAYVVDGLRAERVRPVLEVAMARFRREQKLLGELADTRQKLLDRKLVDRAKGLLMARHRLTEEEAYARLRSMAMNKNVKLAEIAQRILDAEDLLGWSATGSTRHHQGST